MPPRDILLALVVVLIWGVNFAVIRIGVSEVPPLLLGALRFIAAAFPAVLLFRRPRLPLGAFLAYGLTISVGQFALLFTAIHVGMPSGLASLVLQSQAFFTLIFAAWWLGESWRPTQVLGLLLAGAGLVLIGSAHGLTMPLGGFLLTVAAASMWAAGNIVTRVVSRHAPAGKPVDMQAFVVWSCLVPPVPFLLLSWWLEGSAAIQAALAGFSLQSAFAVGYLAWMATLVGYGLWSRLLARHPANHVAPFSLLVPLVGLSTGWLVFGERLQAVHLAGGALLMAGLAVNLFGTRLLALLRRKTA
jgi:O-acetylserine/cysteine efflux transporter